MASNNHPHGLKVLELDLDKRTQHCIRDSNATVNHLIWVSTPMSILKRLSSFSNLVSSRILGCGAILPSTLPGKLISCMLKGPQLHLARYNLQVSSCAHQ